MELKTVLLNNNLYQEYLNGQEVECTANQINNKNIQPGDHIMVYKDTLASASDIPTPTREKQSEYIGIEGTVTQINTLTGIHRNEAALQSLKVRKL